MVGVTSRNAPKVDAQLAQHWQSVVRTVNVKRAQSRGAEHDAYSVVGQINPSLPRLRGVRDVTARSVPTRMQRCFVTGRDRHQCEPVLQYVLDSPANGGGAHDCLCGLVKAQIATQSALRLPPGVATAALCPAAMMAAASVSLSTTATGSAGGSSGGMISIALLPRTDIALEPVALNGWPSARRRLQPTSCPSAILSGKWNSWPFAMVPGPQAPVTGQPAPIGRLVQGGRPSAGGPLD